MDASNPERKVISSSVGSFFDEVSARYDESIRKAIPPYQEMFDSVLGYSFLENDKPWHILELGCGTGNLSLCIQEIYPNANLTLIDLSHEMLESAAQKLRKKTGSVKLIESGFIDLDLPAESFDLIISSMALHHLTDEEKPTLYNRIYQWLKPGGLFRCADETLALPQTTQSEQMRQWEVWARENGATSEDIILWSEHAESYDHYASLQNHFRWLADSGFINVDCYWKKLMWTVFGAQKPE